MPLMLIAGLAVDFFTFQNIQTQTALMMLGLYFVAAGLAIAYIHISDTPGMERPPISKFAHLAASMVIQFAFGALLSASLVFYWFSGSIAVSWPFILLIAFLMVSNDVFRRYYSKPIVQIGVYYFTCFSLLSLALPFLLNTLSMWTFLYAGALSLVFITFYVAGLSRLVLHIRERRYRLFLPVAFVFTLMNVLYFTNVIPPIPLSLREAGMYHDVRRDGSVYRVKAESESFWQGLIPGQKVRLGPGERLYVFSSIFAPADLHTTVVHDWQYYDEGTGEWVQKDKLKYSLSGGRKDGYRGYTTKSSVEAGRWRVDIETERGQVLGRMRFTVERVSEKPPLVDLEL